MGLRTFYGSDLRKSNSNGGAIGQTQRNMLNPVRDRLGYKLQILTSSFQLPYMQVPQLDSIVLKA